MFAVSGTFCAAGAPANGAARARGPAVSSPPPCAARSRRSDVSLSSRVRLSRAFLAPRGRVAGRESLRATALFGPPPDPDALLQEGKALYASGERMQGYKTFEKALRADDASLALPTRQELLYSCMCCNAAFGDVETAKQFLRDMMIAGMPFDEAMAYGGSGKFMMLESSAQMRNQLIKFASGEMKSQGTVQREIFEKTRAETGTGSLGGSVGANPIGQKPQRMGDMDLMNLDIAGDTSAEAKDIAKRVVGLIVLSVVGFIGLFQVGLQFLR